MPHLMGMINQVGYGLSMRLGFTNQVGFEVSLRPNYTNQEGFGLSLKSGYCLTSWDYTHTQKPQNIGYECMLK